MINIVCSFTLTPEGCLSPIYTNGYPCSTLIQIRLLLGFSAAFFLFIFVAATDGIHIFLLIFIKSATICRPKIAQEIPLLNL